MALRRDILRRPETLADMDAACVLRWREGDRLLAGGDYSGAVYLLGYVIEMRLKLAAFRRTTRRVTDQAGPIRIGVRSWMRANVPSVPDESGHSLAYWVAYLQAFRPATAPPYTRAVLRGLRRHVLGSAFQNWKVEMRYRDAQVGYDVAWRTWLDAYWIEEHWPRL